MELSFLVFVLLPKISSHVLNSACLPALLRPFSLVSIPLTLLSAALPIPRLNQSHKPQHYLGLSPSHLWWHLTQLGCLSISTLFFAALTSSSCYNLSWQHAQPEGFSTQLFSLSPGSLLHDHTISKPSADRQTIFTIISQSWWTCVSFYCHCHWSHFFIKMPLLFCSLPFLLLLLLFSALLYKSVSQPFLCSLIALSHDSPQIASTEKFGRAPHPVSTLIHPWMWRLVCRWQADPIGVGFFTLVSSCCLQPGLNSPSHLKDSSPGHVLSFHSFHC